MGDWGGVQNDLLVKITDLGGDSSRSKQSRVLVHVQRDASNVVWFQHPRTKIVDEAECGGDQGRRAGYLGASRGCGVVPANDFVG